MLSAYNTYLVTTHKNDGFRIDNENMPKTVAANYMQEQRLIATNSPHCQRTEGTVLYNNTHHTIHGQTHNVIN